LLAIAGLLAGMGGGVGAARAALAAHGAGETGVAPLHVGAFNDAGGTNSVSSGIVNTTFLIGDVGGVLLRVINLHEDGMGGIAVSGSHTATNGRAGGFGLAAFGGGHTSAGGSSGNIGGHGVEGTGGACNGTSPQAFAGDGVRGEGANGFTSTRDGAGVRGIHFGGGPGVIGHTNSSVHAGVTGVNGGSNFGVYGSSFTGVGVRGVSFGATAAGVEGVAGGSGPGVWGFTSSGHAVLGNSSTGNGGVFAGKTGVTTTGSPNALVANGNVHCTGAGKFIGGIIVATRSTGGDLQATYGVTSPDAVVADFGRARLVNGSARVELDPAFAALVGSADYAVFPVAGGNCNGLYVTNRSPSAFELREFNNGTSTVDVDYRVVAKRAGTQAARFARVVEPETIAIPTMADVPRSFADLAHLTRFDKPERHEKTRGADQPAQPSGGQPAPRR
jgi:hypothetical protein